MESYCDIFARLAEANPEPALELNYTTHFELLIAAVLSPKTTDRQVNRVTKELFTLIKSPYDILNLPAGVLQTTIASLGLYAIKAQRIIALCQILLERHDGLVPNNRLQLEALPGVGRKVANLLINELFGQPVIAVDTHVFRVSKRLHLAPPDISCPLKLEKFLYKTIPEKYHMKAHLWLVWHGRYVCTARKPNCASCMLADLCPSYLSWQGTR